MSVRYGSSDDRNRVNVSGRPWIEYRKKKEKEYAKDRKVWVYNYTLVDRKVIFVSYVYRVTAGEEEPEYYREEAQQILNNVRF